MGVSQLFTAWNCWAVGARCLQSWAAGSSLFPLHSSFGGFYGEEKTICSPQIHNPPQNVMEARGWAAVHEPQSWNCEVAKMNHEQEFVSCFVPILSADPHLVPSCSAWGSPVCKRQNFRVLNGLQQEGEKWKFLIILALHDSRHTLLDVNQFNMGKLAEFYFIKKGGCAFSGLLSVVSA